MKRADAPNPGWYPDPVNDDRLRWWDGTDWTDDRRVGPRPTDVSVRPDNPSRTTAPNATSRLPRSTPSAGRRQGRPSNARRTKSNTRTQAAAAAELSGQDASAIVEEVRRATRSELDRATSRLTRQAGDMRSEFGPLIEAYVRRFLRWARRIAIIAVVLYILYLFASAQVQTGLFDWAGDRVDEFLSQ